MIRGIKEDLKYNIFLKSKFVIVFFRVANFFATNGKLLLVLGAPIILLYIVIVEWILGIEIPVKTKIGKGFVIYHGYGLVINGFAEIGDYCKVRQGCCIGNKMNRDGSYSGAPKMGNNVELGVNAVVIGDILIGDDVQIGANAVVVKNVEPNTTVVGIPAKEIEK